jgi:PAS domain-containing protein
MRREFRQTFVRMMLAVLAVGAAWVVTEILYWIDQPLRQRGAFAFFLAAVAIAAWRGGILPALTAIFCSTLIIAWVLPPSNSFRVDSQEDIVRLLLFVGIGLLISYLHFSRNRAERSLEQSERRLNFSLDSAGVGCWDANIAKGTFWKSHNLAGIFGRSESEFATTYEGFFAYIHAEDREFFRLATVGSGTNHRDYEISHRIVLPDGTTRKVNTRGRMYLGEEGRVERMVGAVFVVEPIGEGAGGPSQVPHIADGLAV